MDPQKTINEVVDSVKSEGLFDQFRKECLEEFENMETYHQLKQRVENHVTSFLSKRRYHDGLQKNTLRSNLRNYVSKSDVLLNSIQQLVDEVLSLKGHSFCLRIDKQVDKHLSKNVPLPSPAEDNANKDDIDKSEQPGSVTTGASVEGNKELNIAGEFSEMTEIEEVEMEISENQESAFGDPCSSNQINNNDELDEVLSDESVVYDGPMERLAKLVESESACRQGEDNVNMASKDDTLVDEIKPGVDSSSNLMNSHGAVSVKALLNDAPLRSYELTGDEENRCGNNQRGANENKGENDSVLHPIITEPISDCSDSNDSIYPKNVKPQDLTSLCERPGKKEESESRRKSSRVRTLPLKFREDFESIKKRVDDADSVSSNDIDYDDADENNLPTRIGRRGRPRKRPLSACRNERRTPRGERHSSLSRANIDSMIKGRRSASLNKMEEDAREFLIKKECEESDMRGNATSLKTIHHRRSMYKKDRNSESPVLRRERFDTQCDDGKHSFNSRRKSESREQVTSNKDGDRKNKTTFKKRDHQSSRERNEAHTRDEVVSSRCRRDRDISRETPSNIPVSSDEKHKSKRYHKSASREGSTSSKEDIDKRQRNSKDGTTSSSSKEGADRNHRKSRDRTTSASSKEDAERSHRKSRDRTLSTSSKEDVDRSHRKSRDGKTSASNKEDAERSHRKSMDRTLSTSSKEDVERSHQKSRDGKASASSKEDAERNHRKSRDRTISTSSKEDLDRSHRKSRDGKASPSRKNRDRPISPIWTSRDRTTSPTLTGRDRITPSSRKSRDKATSPRRKSRDRTISPSRKIRDRTATSNRKSGDRTTSLRNPESLGNESDSRKNRDVLIRSKSADLSYSKDAERVHHRKRDENSKSGDRNILKESDRAPDEVGNINCNSRKSKSLGKNSSGEKSEEKRRRGEFSSKMDEQCKKENDEKSNTTHRSLLEIRYSLQTKIDNTTDKGEDNSFRNKDDNRDSSKLKDAYMDCREETDYRKNDSRRKRLHSPTVSTTDTSIKRSKRSIKQRQRYSP